ncbi:hypothetical protein ABGB14_49680 [Nonomuraea sp. B10E15]|uniref:hypothetical protein n=1 Tax=Nonomuraea sp. B10E15 TaxID=3153560 RepID=UPI00325EFBD6
MTSVVAEAGRPKASLDVDAFQRADHGVSGGGALPDHDVPFSSVWSSIPKAANNEGNRAVLSSRGCPNERSRLA